MPRIFDNIDQKLLPALQETLNLVDHADFCQEALAILADKKLAKELLNRRKDAFGEMEKGTLIETGDLFR
jgi:tetraacyldisaccharide-1-P 4'-kinase